MLTRSAHSIYAQCVDEVDYESFFKGIKFKMIWFVLNLELWAMFILIPILVCAMPDTFQSWFIVAQLHIWLCLVRLKREDENGKFIIHHLVKFFWKDVQERLNLLGVSFHQFMYHSFRVNTIHLFIINHSSIH